MQRNVANQKWILYAYQNDSGTTPGAPATGIAATLTSTVVGYDAAGAATVTALTGNPSEIVSGYYEWTIPQAVTDAVFMLIIPGSSDSTVNVMGAPPTIYTTPPNISALSITAAGRVDVDAVSGTQQTAGDLAATLTSWDASFLTPTLTAVQTDIPTAVATMQANVTDILEDTATTIPGVLTSWQTNYLTPTLTAVQTTLPTNIATMQADVTEIREDTETTIPATLTSWQTNYLAPTLEAATVTIPGVFDEIKGVGWTGETLVALGATLDGSIQGHAATQSQITARLDATDATLEAIQGAGWTDQTLVALSGALMTSNAKHDNTQSQISATLDVIQGQFDDVKGVGWTDENLTTLQASVNGAITGIGNNSTANGAIATVLGDVVTLAQSTRTLVQNLPESILTEEMTEGYATPGNPITVAQSLYSLTQFLTARREEGATTTVYQLDGVSPAMTLTRSFTVPTPNTIERTT